MNDTTSIRQQIIEQKRKLVTLKNAFIDAAFAADISGQRQYGIELHNAKVELHQMEVAAASQDAENFKVKMDNLVRRLQ